MSLIVIPIISSTLIPIVIVSIGGGVAIIYTIMDFIHKMQKTKYAAEGRGNVNVQALENEVKQNKKDLTKALKRIESLEAIIVDNDMLNLETGLSSRMEEEKESYSQSRKQSGIEELL